MEHQPFNLYVDGIEYELVLYAAGKQGTLPSYYNEQYRYTSPAAKEPGYVTITITDPVLDMWGLEVVEDDGPDKLHYFCLQVLPRALGLAVGSGNKSYRVIFHRDDNVNREKEGTYLQAFDTPQATARSYSYGGQNLANTRIRREILTNCYATWQSNPHGFILATELLQRIPVNEVELQRNLKYLVDKGLINSSLTSGGYLMARITETGIDAYENPEIFDRLFSLKVEQQTVNVGGDYIAPVVVGSGNTVNIKSAIEKSFIAIKEELDLMVSENKEDAKGLINDLESELTKPEPDASRVQELWAKIKKLPAGINETVLKHPIIAQIIAQLLLNRTDQI